MKISRKKLRRAICKLDGAIQLIDGLRNEVFLKECAQETLEKATDLITEAMGKLERGRRG